MATIQRNVKTFGTRSFVGEVAAAPSNYAPILSNEVDADLDTVYSAWNGGMDSVNLKDGSVTYAKLAPDAQLWADTGTALTQGTSFTTRPVSIPTNLTAGVTTIESTGTVRSKDPGGAIRTHVGISSPGTLLLGVNDWRAPEVAAWPSWFATFDANPGLGGDSLVIRRRAANAAAGTQTALLTLDAAGKLTVPGSAQTLGPASGSLQIQLGPRALLNTDAAVYEVYENAATAQTYDRNGVPSWMIRLTAVSDGIQFFRRAAGTDTYAERLSCYGTNGDFLISGANAQKASGTTWSNPSDRRLKDDIEDYPTGLAAIMQLQPRTFVYNGKGGSTAGMRGYGFVADEIAPVMPETVGVRAGKLDPADEDETDIQTLDQSNLILALVNAMKELAARVTALEGAPA
jgi:hypothetical protein